MRSLSELQPDPHIEQCADQPGDSAVLQSGRKHIFKWHWAGGKSGVGGGLSSGWQWRASPDWVEVDISPTGRLLVATNAYMTFYAGSSLVSASAVEVQDGLWLSFANDSPARDLTLLPGSALLGTGVLQFNGTDRLVVEADVIVNLLLQMNDNSVVTGTGLLTVRGNQTLTGTYEARVSIDGGASAGLAGRYLLTWSRLNQRSDVCQL